MVGGWGAAVGTPVRVVCGAFGASSLFFVRLRNLKNLIELTKIRNNMDDCGCGSFKIPCLMSLAAGVGLGGLSCQQLTTGLRSDKAVCRLCGVWRVACCGAAAAFRIAPREPLTPPPPQQRGYHCGFELTSKRP